MPAEPGFIDGPVELKVKKWKKHWTIVKGGYLQYFDTDKFPEGQRPAETIVLRGAKLRKTDKKESKRDFAFVVVYVDGKKTKELFVAPGAEDQLHQWVQACRESIAIANPTVFGVDLSIGAAKSQDKKLPTVVVACLSSLARRKGEAGIFRVSGSLAEVNKLKDAFDHEQTPDLTSIDVHVVSGTLKLYLRELPDPLLTYHLYDKYLKASKLPTREQIAACAELFTKLPPAHRELLLVLLKFVHDVSKEEKTNMMSTLNLATVFGPTIMRPRHDSEADAGNSDNVINLTDTMISYWEACCGLAEVPASTPRSPRANASGSAAPASGGGGGAAAAAAAGGGGGGATPAKATSSHGWKEYKTKEGRPYYYHKATKKTSWKRPPEMDEDGGADSGGGDDGDEQPEEPHHTGPQFNLGGLNPADALGALKAKKAQQEAAARKAEEARREAAEKALREQREKDRAAAAAAPAAAPAAAAASPAPALTPAVRATPPIGMRGPPPGVLGARNTDMSVNGRLEALDAAVTAMEAKQTANYDLLKQILAKLEA